MTEISGPKKGSDFGGVPLSPCKTTPQLGSAPYLQIFTVNVILFSSSLQQGWAE